MSTNNKLEINNLTVEIVKKDIKNIHLGVYPPKGRVRVAAPLKTSDESIRLLVILKTPWIKKQISIFLEKWERVLRVNVNEILIKKMKTKWGTCNSESKRIWLNLELAKKPIHCLEYVLVHEMIHLLEKKHSDKFKARMDSAMPNWNQYKNELNKYPLSHSDWKY